MKSFRLQNIKGFIDSGDLTLRPLTIIIGQNSSGKSSVMRFPLVLRQTFLDDSVAPLLFYGKSIDYGNFEDVVHNHDKSTEIGFSIAIDSRYIRRLAMPRYHQNEQFKKWFETNECIVEVRISQHAGKVQRLQTDFFEIRNSQGQKLLSIVRTSNGDSFEVTFFKDIRVHMSESNLTFDKFIPNLRRSRIIDGIKNEELEELIDIYSNIIYPLNFYFNNLANSVSYIGPFRKTPERSYRYIENSVDYVGGIGEFAPVILGHASLSGSDLVRNVSDWLRDNLDFTLDVRNLGGDMFQILITDQQTKAQNNLIDVGHGLSQLIPIVVQTLMDRHTLKRYNSVTKRIFDLNIIEQPELHLHPAAQAMLADLFVTGVNNKKQFLVETHSEHMLIRLRRYIAEDKLKPTDIAIYYTEKTSSQSVQMYQLEIDELGNIQDWPEGFFSEDYKEVLALRKAIARKTSKGTSQLW